MRGGFCALFERFDIIVVWRGSARRCDGQESLRVVRLPIVDCRVDYPSRYFLNVLVDTTIGVFILLLCLKLVDFGMRRYGYTGVSNQINQISQLMRTV